MVMMRLLCWGCLLSLAPACGAGQLRLAVASNFIGPIHAIARTFETETGNPVIVSAGSTGKLYAQIVNGAPYDLFLAANSREPQRLEDDQLIGPGSRYTYALGVLALWAPGVASDEAADARAALAAADGQRLAVANPQTAPYGAAALAVLEAWQQSDVVQGRLIRGENIAQTYQFVASGNAGWGFVALSQLLDPKRPPAGRYWRIDPSLYPPIRQQVVILKRAADNPVAAAFWRYLKSAPVRTRIAAFGYGLE
jgi:molybdate transport system substrate-binding protein